MTVLYMLISKYCPLSIYLVKFVDMVYACIYNITIYETLTRSSAKKSVIRDKRMTIKFNDEQEISIFPRKIYA